MRGPCAAAARVLGSVAVLGLACDRLPGRPDEAERYRRPSEITDFATLYGTHCSGCHGAAGTLGPSRPLADPVYLALVGTQRLRRIVAEGVKGTPMPAFARSEGGWLTEVQIDAIAQGLLERWGRGGVGSAGLPPYSEADSRAAGTGAGDATRGETVYASFCASCHGPGGRGSETAGSVVDASFLALVSDQMLRTAVIAGRTDLGMPDWRDVGPRPMTPQEISDVVAWLTEQRVAFPGQPYPQRAQP